MIKIQKTNNVRVSKSLRILYPKWFAKWTDFSQTIIRLRRCISWFFSMDATWKTHRFRRLSDIPIRNTGGFYCICHNIHAPTDYPKTFPLNFTKGENRTHWSRYRPITFKPMFEPRHNILLNVRANVRKYVVTWLEHSPESNRSAPGSLSAELSIESMFIARFVEKKPIFRPVTFFAF